MNFNIIKRPLFLIISALGMLLPSVTLAQSANWLMTKSDTATVPKEIEDPQCLGINKEPYHATLMPYASLTEALKANRHASEFYRSLNGYWKFNWVPWPQQRPVNFYQPGYDVSRWRDIKVPSNWQVEGYGTPYYSNYTYIFKKDFPHVMSTPPVSWTAYKERNPVGSYRRNFEVPANWKGRRIFVTFDGVDAGFFLWVNGKKVGYSVNSRNAAEFDITKYVKPGKNIIAAEVYRFTVGSYLEDQDMWRLSGIFRNVTLWSSPQEHIRDFFVKTDLDGAYDNATENIVAKVKNYSNAAVPSRTLTAVLYDKNGTTAIARGTVTVPALQAGKEIAVNVSFRVQHPLKWTAETPNLYTTVLSLNNKGKEVEILSSQTGFRKIEIKGRLFLVNGVPVKLKGVNRHENWPDVGHAISEDQMVQDILLIKQANCNHIRTCHYSDDPRWYELCDKYGIYLLAEANLECHGAWDEFNEEPTIKAALIDRNVANVENFKNHPSVIIWSLGNECGSGGSNFRAILSAIKSIDISRPTHYQGFGIGAQNPADMDSEMYTNLKSLEEHARDNTLTKPFYLCEYAHTMFNSMGSVDEYNDLFDKYPSLLGGCIWEWQDQGIYNRIDPKHPITAFGGGFGEVPNDHYFIHKGVVFSDRSLKPQYPELKHAYQWIRVKPADLQNGLVLISNKYQFINLGGFQASWSLFKNGEKVGSGNLPLPQIPAGDSATVKVPYHVPEKADAEYIVRLSFTLNHDELWAKKGFELASQQLIIPGTLYQQPAVANNGPLRLNTDTANIYVTGTGFSFVFSKSRGYFTSIKNTGGEILTDNKQSQYLHLWRAPHRNDDMWANDSWDKYGLKNLKWSVKNVACKNAGNDIQIAVELTGAGKEGFKVKHRATYTIKPGGTMLVANEVSFEGEKIPLARIGVRWFLDKRFNQFSYYGRGPMENYADRKMGSDIGVYSSSVKEQLTPYEKPMEAGNHEDIRWAKLASTAGGFEVINNGEPLQVSALPYADEDMEKVEYRIDLPQSDKTVLCIDTKTLGVGSNSCGPEPLEKYVPRANDQSFSYMLNIR